MTNPYESPKVDCSTEPKGPRRPPHWKTILFGLLGAFFGYVCLTILANLEDWQFYTIRRLVTGETVMSRITQHPADRWVLLILIFGFVLSGAFSGMWLARRSSGKAQ